MNLDNLKQHLQTDPDNRGYASKTDEQKVADLLTKRRVGAYSGTIKDIASKLGVALAGRLVEELERQASTNAILRHTLKLLENGQTINLGDTVTRGMLDVMQASVGTKMSAGDAAAIKGLANNLLSDAEFYGFNGVTVGDIQQTRRI